MTHCRIKKHPPQIKRGGCFFVFGKNFNLMTLAKQQILFAFLWGDFVEYISKFVRTGVREWLEDGGIAIFVAAEAGHLVIRLFPM